MTTDGASEDAIDDARGPATDEPSDDDLDDVPDDPAGTSPDERPDEGIDAAVSTGSGDQHPPAEAVVESRLEDALERVAHGATVSVPGILAERALSVAFTAVLTNGFGAAAYGVFVLARRMETMLLHLALGFKGGLSRFLPNADTDRERDVLVTIGAVVTLGVAVAFGVGLYLAAPTISAYADVGAPGQFETLVRVFAVGLPVMAALFIAVEVMRGLEAVGPLTLTARVGFPLAQLAVAAGAVLFLDDVLAVAVGVVAVGALVGLVATAWLAHDRGIRPRIRGPNVRDLWDTYVSFTLPLFAAGFATVTQRLGFYPLIAWFLTGLAGGVFAVGVLVGSLVRLPLMAINQFIPPVAADLNESGHHRALSRLYHVTSRIVLVGVTAVGVPVVVHRRQIMALFGDAFVPYAGLLVGFVVAQYVACAAGSVGILLTMTDNQRALLVVNTVVTATLVVTAIPLTATYGLVGLVASYVFMLTFNNVLEVVALYHLEALQPLTRRHGFTLVAAIPLAVVALAGRELVPGPTGLIAGTLLGLGTYAWTLSWLGFTPVERRLVGTLADRYRDALARD